MACSQEIREEKARRIELVAEWLMSGILWRDVVKKGIKEFGCTSRSMEAYLKEVRDNVLPTMYSMGDTMKMVPEAIARAERHYEMCIESRENGWLSAGLACLKWIGELQGLSATQRASKEVEHLRERVRDLEKEAQKGNHGVTLDQFNQIRMLYNMPTLNKWEFESFVKDQGAYDPNQGSAPKPN